MVTNCKLQLGHFLDNNHRDIFLIITVCQILYWTIYWKM